MPPVYTVRARVIDTRRDTPRPTDAFLVDTNVWFWYACQGAGALPGSATTGQMQDYSNYLRRAQAVGAIAYRTGLCFAELAHLIEQNEREAYSQAGDESRLRVPPARM